MTSPRLMLCRITSAAPPVEPLGLVGTFDLPEFGEAYESRLTITGGGATLSLLRVGALPLGLVASIDHGTRELVIAGTPLERGVYAFTLTVSDEYLQSASIVVGWTVAAPPFELTGTLDPATEGEAYSSGLGTAYAVGAVTWSLPVGPLPAGLGPIDPDTGIIAGTSTENGSFPITIRGVDSIGQIAESEQTLEVSVACDPFWASVVAGSLCDGTNGATSITAITGPAWGIVQSNTDTTVSTADSVQGGASVLIAAAPATGFSSAVHASPEGGPCTWECWFKCTNMITRRAILSYQVYNNTAAPRSVVVLEADGSLRWYHRGPSTLNSNIVSSAGAVTENTWHHVAAVRNGDTHTLYLDGVAVASTTSSGSLGAASGFHRFFIGSGYYGANIGFIGRIDLVRFTFAARYTGAFMPPARFGIGACP